MREKQGSERFPLAALFRPETEGSNAYFSAVNYHRVSPIVVLHGQVLPGDLRECRASRPPVDVADGQTRRRGSRTDVGSNLSRIHELADHLRKHVSTRGSLLELDWPHPR